VASSADAANIRHRQAFVDIDTSVGGRIHSKSARADNSEVSNVDTLARALRSSTSKDTAEVSAVSLGVLLPGATYIHICNSIAIFIFTEQGNRRGAKFQSRRGIAAPVTIDKLEGSGGTSTGSGGIGNLAVEATVAVATVDISIGSFEVDVHSEIITNGTSALRLHANLQI